MKSPFEQQLERVITQLTELGHGQIQINTLSYLMWFYHMGQMSLDELCRESPNETRNTVMLKTKKLVGRGLLDDISQPRHRMYKLNSNVRKVINESLDA